MIIMDLICNWPVIVAITFPHELSEHGVYPNISIQYISKYPSYGHRRIGKTSFWNWLDLPVMLKNLPLASSETPWWKSNSRRFNIFYSNIPYLLLSLKGKSEPETMSGWWFQPTPLKNLSSSVGKIDIPNCFWKVIIQSCSSHHQPAIDGSSHYLSTGKVIKFHGSKAPTRCFFTIHFWGLSGFRFSSLQWLLPSTPSFISPIMTQNLKRFENLTRNLRKNPHEFLVEIHLFCCD